MVGYYRYARVPVVVVIDNWYVCREYQSRTPELPRLKRLFTGRRNRIQRSVSLRVHSSARSQPSGVRSFATQSFSGADRVKVERVMPADEAATPIVVTTRFVSRTTSLVNYLGVPSVYPQKYVS